MTFFKKMYGEKMYNQILTLIASCLRYNPQERISLVEVLQNSLFKDVACNCTDCSTVSYYMFPQKNVNIQFDELLTVYIPQQYNTLLPYAWQIYERALDYYENLDSTEDLQLQVASLSLAAKLLRIPASDLRERWLKLLNITRNKLNLLEIEIIEDLNWNID